LLHPFRRSITAPFADQIAGNNIAGVLLPVIKNGKFFIYKPYGYLDKSNNKSMTTNAIFNLASMIIVMAAVGGLTFMRMVNYHSIEK
jgi:CubicO group peptidase (beta-lactamase class C family)